jgi:hypothetical protein
MSCTATWMGPETVAGDLADGLHRAEANLRAV